SVSWRAHPRLPRVPLYFDAPPATPTYTLSLHDALPISRSTSNQSRLSRAPNPRDETVIPRRRRPRRSSARNQTGAILRPAQVASKRKHFRAKSRPQVGERRGTAGAIGRAFREEK